MSYDGVDPGWWDVEMRINRLFFAPRFVRTIIGGGLRIQSSKPMVKYNNDIPMVTYNSQAS